MFFIANLSKKEKGAGGEKIRNKQNQHYYLLLDT